MLRLDLAASPRCVRLYRALLSVLVAAEVADKWPTLEWLYSDAGALPRDAVFPTFEGEGLTHEPASLVSRLSLSHASFALSLYQVYLRGWSAPTAGRARCDGRKRSRWRR